MPDTLNKQSLINLLIDSPLREPIKINLIDIVNNTSEPDLPKIYTTITKELEIFQKATERRMKLAEETIAKLGGATSAQAPNTAPAPTGLPENGNIGTPSSTAIPPLDLPPLPTPPVAEPVATATPAPLTVPPLDLPPMPASTSSSLGGPTANPMQAVEPAMPAPAPTAEPAKAAPAPETPAPVMQPLGGPAPSTSSDEDALAEIQKELDSLKTATATEISSAAAPVAPTK